jgi:hypothetical protein
MNIGHVQTLVMGSGFAGKIVASTLGIGCDCGVGTRSH